MSTFSETKSTLKPYVIELLKKNDSIDFETLVQYYCEKKKPQNYKGNKGRNPLENFICEDLYDYNTQKKPFNDAITLVKNILRDEYKITLIEQKYQRERESRGRKATRYFWPKDVEKEVLNRLEQSHRLLRESETAKLLSQAKGLVHQSWMADFLKMKAQDQTSHNILIEFEQGILKNIELIPSLYYAIRDKQVISFKYNTGVKRFTVYMSPYYLKEYNQRWFILGKTIHKDKNKSGKNFQYAIDRIDSDIRIQKTMIYQPSEINYTTHFNDRIGISEPQEKEKLEEIIIRTKSLYFHNLLITKPIHKSQKTISDFDEQKGYGELSIKVRYTPELLGKIFLFESNIEVVSPKNGTLYQKMKEESKKLYEMYKTNEEN